METKTNIRKTGGSLMLIIPKAYSDYLGLFERSEVILSDEEDDDGVRKMILTKAD
jgi:antitoxin component of MazEF toxin-antitoxin module